LYFKSRNTAFLLSFYYLLYALFRLIVYTGQCPVGTYYYRTEQG